ncbi:beta-1,6-N-acetylglucosaminyltransferase [Elizabethkingia meningoseptica]|uniref:beta-1,6-N-acetylglucosaminyltransferase n=1 Tax=Elizabethkingia meningoseptica TaxID=238 RepID=UPI0022F1661E|nr:beta-1,6-N-acetylglucosaminyltransferase [Elizabethkingia meningoseptica]EJK5329546.1 glycosyl transferase [Elizabethkingia meningoseptica]MDE5469386.1 beta-1,6-N-acetylglucosaminyltransferase [Elizabethkingia meningoseptica]MDE5475300.1 beta-1,6-N-acetylglucosaminyltransferase [Elizabethkingia meningoseptica]MDE5478733.1 beta-1,6-N-acetylglucosaminyltransferase [Elizabethkingia meningoseptica]MDE5486427.1 beta-1,6-N-acetylglucosaminyltransferase [Elizabethkingia meningoseptica]
MKKHAYLILAHNEYPVLECLIRAIDDPRNTIFIHFDKKVNKLPVLKTRHAEIHILKSRIDVRWGDVSVVEAEFKLFEEALKVDEFLYYHLLSGVDIPLKKQDEIHAFFDQHNGKEFIGYSTYDYHNELERKVNRYHLFPKDFRLSPGIKSQVKRLIRYGSLKIQSITGYRRNTKIDFKKGTQWVSLTNDFIRYTISKKNEVLKTYQNTFCSDEIFIQTLCWNSSFRDQIFNYKDEGEGCMRMIGWKNGVLYDWEDKDYDILTHSKYLFARKFNSRNLEVVNRILHNIL